MNILSVISSTKLKEINIKGFNGFFTLNNLYYSTNLKTRTLRESFRGIALSHSLTGLGSKNDLS